MLKPQFHAHELKTMHKIVSRMEQRLKPFDMAARFDVDLGMITEAPNFKRINQQQKTRPSAST